jgi:hypothetical protein
MRPLAEMFDMTREDHQEFHDLCKKLLSFEPNSRMGAAKAMEHKFFNLEIVPEYSEASLLLYPDAPIPPPTMPPPVNAIGSKAAAGSGSIAGVSSGIAAAAATGSHLQAGSHLLSSSPSITT